MTPMIRRLPVRAIIALTIGAFAMACSSHPAPRRTASVPASSASSPAWSPVPANCCAALERAVLDELNRVRVNPARYAASIEAEIPYYQGRIFQRPTDAVSLSTREGAAAAKEAVRALRASPALPLLRSSMGMALGARDHVKDQGPRGGMEHKGTDGSMAWDRVNRYGAWKTKISENMSFGPASGRDVVVALLIDDGVAERGHRKNILDPEIHIAGVSCGYHKLYRVMCDIVHATSFVERQTASTGKE
jgi:uncharacterized protein YkwD